jgi:hypothetical protein
VNRVFPRCSFEGNGSFHQVHAAREAPGCETKVAEILSDGYLRRRRYQHVYVMRENLISIHRDCHSAGLGRIRHFDRQRSCARVGHFVFHHGTFRLGNEAQHPQLALGVKEVRIVGVPYGDQWLAETRPVRTKAAVSLTSIAGLVTGRVSRNGLNHRATLT